MKINEAVTDNDLFFGQLSSRVAMRYDLTEDLRGGLGGGSPKPLHSVDEIRRLYETSKVRFTDEGRLLLTKIANIPGLGGLRLCTKLVEVARPLARGEAIDAALLLKIIRGMHGLAHAADRIERAIERSLIRVA